MFLVTCRVDNDCFLGHICLQNTCLFGCHSDDDCSASESCRDNKCTNPCVHGNPCGPNALCSVTNQRAACSCTEGMVPNPTAKVGCVRTPAGPCQENRACDNGWSCIQGQCRPVCSSDTGCLVNERCDKPSGTCKPVCRKQSDCPSGEVCQNLVCQIGCHSDSGCPSDKACVNSQCTNICATPTACGRNAVCSVVNHNKQCSCPPPLVGDPLSACKQQSVTCSHNKDCPSGLSCYGALCQTSCRNDQNCLSDEKCVRGICRGVCNSDSACASGQICENRICKTGCRTDTSCDNFEACIDGKCTDPCTIENQCGKCSQCKVINHGVQCSCPPLFLGNPLTECSKPPVPCNNNCQCDQAGYCKAVCGDDSHCSCGQKCSDGICKTLCSTNNKCLKGQICSRGVCTSGCVSDSDCSNDKSCLNTQCTNPCDLNVSPCGQNALCRVSQHQAVCLCPDGYSGEPLKSCQPYECLADADCAPDKYCSPSKTCKNPCLEVGACGRNAQCRVVDRHAQCMCVPGYFGNAAVECKQGGDAACLKNPCGDNARCRDLSEGNYECSCAPNCIGDPHKGCLCDAKLINLCKDKQCGVNAACRITSLQEAECHCPDNYPSGDPYIECKY